MLDEGLSWGWYGEVVLLMQEDDDENKMMMMGRRWCVGVRILARRGMCVEEEEDGVAWVGVQGGCHGWFEMMMGDEGMMKNKMMIMVKMDDEEERLPWVYYI